MFKGLAIGSRSPTVKDRYSAVRSKICQEGNTDKNLSCLLMCCTGGIARTLCTKLECINITPLGAAVVPEV